MFSIPAVRPSFLAAAVMLTAAIALSACGGGSAGGAPSDTNSNQTSSTSSGTGTAAPQSPTGSNNNSTGQTVSLSWTIPTQRTDGSSLPVSQLAGYQIYYYADGSSAGSGQVININDPLVTTYTTQVLPPATYNFAIAAVDTTGLASPLSSPVTITVQ